MDTRARGVVAIALAVSVTAVIGGCGGGGGGEPVGGESISVRGTEFAFDPSTLSASADSAFTVEFANDGTIGHDFAVEGKDSAKIVAGAGSEASGSFTLAAGTYKFFCSVPGHEKAGMVGTLTVE